MKRIKFVIVALLILACKSRLNKELEIKPPLKDIEFRELSVTIDPTKEQIARFSNGLSVEIPESAFSDENGNPVTGEVTLLIKTYNTIAEIIASGIPMAYNDGKNIENFESAGMFQISGKSENSEVFITKGKRLTINYPSSVYGDYDFYYFDKSSSDSIITGSWKKLSDNIKKNPSIKILDEFKLNFSVEDYPELIDISTISWKLATRYGNPKDSANKWVLENKWSSLEIAEPKLGFGDILFSDSVNYDRGYLDHYSIIVSKDSNRIITTHNKAIKIWSKEGKLIKVIDKVIDDYWWIQILNDKYLSIRREEGDCIYNFDGVKMGVLPESYRKELAKSKDVIVFQKGMDPSVYIYTVTGKLIKKIEIKDDEYYIDFNKRIYKQLILTPNDEIVTNSIDGIIIYDLSGKIVRQRKGLYHSIEYTNDNSLIIEEFDGSLLVWNYKDNTEIKSNKNDFNIFSKLIGNTYYSSDIFRIPNTDFIVVNEGNSKISKLWNFRLNTTTVLTFEVLNYSSDSLPYNLIEGYNYTTQDFYLYDISTKKDVIHIPNFTGGIYNDASSYYALLSKDKKRILINNESHCRYYNLDGSLIKDFKLFDSLICCSGFVNNNIVFTVSENCIYRTWDINGKEIASKKLKNEEFISAYSYNNMIVTRGKVLNKLQIYDINGELLFYPGKTQISQYFNSKNILHHDDKKPAVFRKLFNVYTPIYQLIVSTKDQQFVTYVYLDESDLQKINKYYTFRSRKIKEEQNRQNEEFNLSRRFSIDNFGIYNWDKLIKRENYIEFAADFEFGVPVDYNDICVFLITDINGPAVFRYYKNQWDNFIVDTTVINKLIAILPGNKIALFNQSDFKKIDFNKIKTDRKYQFKMKIIDEPISSLIDLENKLKN